MNSQAEALPLVTAIVICYNQAQFVVEALESVKAQSYPNLHLVVLDDCSTDDSAAIIRQWLNQNYPDAVFVRHATNLGICRTLNEALSCAKGKYIRALAADDIWLPNSLLRQIEVMESVSDDVGILYSDSFQMDQSGKFLPQMFIETHRSFAQMPEGWIFDALVEGNFIPSMTTVTRLRCVDVVGRADESLVTEDWDLWLRISRRFKFKYFPEPTACYRVVETSMTRTMSTAIVESERRMLVKCLRRGWLSGRKKKDAILYEYLGACRAYRDGLPGRTGEAAWVFRHRICMKHALLLLSVAVGLPYKRFERLITSLISMNDRVKVLRNASMA